jgi:hypothetical protein
VSRDPEQEVFCGRIQLAMNVVSAVADGVNSSVEQTSRGQSS